MIPGEATLRHLLALFEPWLSLPDTREIVCNEPGRFGVENSRGWTWYDAPELTYARLDSIAILAAFMTGKAFGPGQLLCSSRLPDGQRITVVRPPVAPQGTILLAIRKRASSFVPTLGGLAERGYFSFLAEGRDWPAFFHEAVLRKRTLVIAGDTGSSKTTFAEALIRAIPVHERIVTLESTPEWFGLQQENWAALVYSDRDPRRSATACLEDATLRLRPDRILMGELRTGEAWAYLRALATGHPGGITTCHARNAEGVFEAIGLMIRQAPAAQGISEADVQAMLRQHVHLVAHCAKVPGDPVPFRLTEVRELQP